MGVVVVGVVGLTRGIFVWFWGTCDLWALYVCMLNEEWKQTWTLEHGIDVKICKIPVF